MMYNQVDIPWYVMFPLSGTTRYPNKKSSGITTNNNRIWGCLKTGYTGIPQNYDFNGDIYDKPLHLGVHSF